jgi:putative hemolysin
MQHKNSLVVPEQKACEKKGGEKKASEKKEEKLFLG